MTPLYPQKLALTSPTGGGRSVGIVRVRTKATEFFFYVYIDFVRGAFIDHNLQSFIPTNYFVTVDFKTIVRWSLQTALNVSFMLKVVTTCSSIPQRANRGKEKISSCIGT